VTRRFAITFDYLCPFARNANEHVIAGLRAGADWDVHFLPYSLAQGHVEEDQQDVWVRTTRTRSLGCWHSRSGHRPRPVPGPLPRRARSPVRRPP
jgi:hypothetical protein